MSGTVADTFEAYRVAVNKPFLDDPDGRAWQRTLGRLMDESFSRTYEARVARFPSECPADGLQYIGSERGIERCIGESETSYRYWLKHAWELWRIAGSATVHQINLGRMGCLSVEVRRRRDFSGVPASPYIYINRFARSVWAQFDVILERPMPWSVRLWGAPPPWGVGLWGSTMTVDQREQVRRLLRTFRSGHDTATYVWMNFGSGKLWGIGPWGLGVWGATGPVSGLIVGELHWAQRNLCPAVAVGFGV